MLLRPYNPFTDSYPFDTLNACDYGDINIIPMYTENTIEINTKEVTNLASKATPFIAGGDHSIALPALRGINKVHGKINLIHLDSHYDFWDSYWGGKKYTDGTWLRRAIEENLLSVVQIGIHGTLYSKEDVADAAKLGITYYDIEKTMTQTSTVVERVAALKGRTYVSFDIDVVDLGSAPGTGTPEVVGYHPLKQSGF